MNKRYKKIILITSSGMMDSAFSKRLLPILAPRKDVDLFIVGYQSPISYGGKIERGARSIFINNKLIPINMKVHKFHIFSGHADSKDILVYLSKNKKSKILLVHGDKQQLLNRKKYLKKHGFNNVFIVKKYKPYEF